MQNFSPTVKNELIRNSNFLPWFNINKMPVLYYFGYYKILWVQNFREVCCLEILLYFWRHFFALCRFVGEIDSLLTELLTHCQYLTHWWNWLKNPCTVEYFKDFAVMWIYCPYSIFHFCSQLRGVGGGGGGGVQGVS